MSTAALPHDFGLLRMIADTTSLTIFFFNVITALIPVSPAVLDFADVG